MIVAAMVSIALVLGWITVQDFRERRISLIALVLLFGLGVLFAGLQYAWNVLPVRIGTNSLFACIILVSGTLLVKIRRPGDSISSIIGSGDLLFLLAISPFFSFGSFLVFLNTSMILTLLGYGIWKVLRHSATETSVPLAGALGICLIVFFILDLFLTADLLGDTDWIYSLIS